MNAKEKAAAICDRLYDIYPYAVCALKWGHESGKDPLDVMLPDGWRLLVMARLSAQCTDARVNIVCEELFKKYTTLRELAECDIHELEDIVRPCGLFRTKAESIKASAIMLLDEYNGVLPTDMDELLRLPGVGRKIANLLRGDIFGLPAVVADTHCIRICGRLGFYSEDLKDPQKVERILSDIIPPDRQSGFCHRIVEFGRDTCIARSPKCAECPLSDLCAHKNE
ncbi:MAG: endonuclease III [Ruminococcaceae bacterium]|nr:endonuclease III [Oscillospiraceae bacterium]